MKSIRIVTRKFLKRFWQYLVLLLGVSLVTEIVVIPILRGLTTYILQAAEIPFISVQNIIILLTHHSWAVLVLLVELSLLILAIYVEFAFLLLGIELIYKEQFSWRMLWYKVRQAIKKIRFSSLGFLILYFLLIMPIADVVYRTPLLAKIHLPQFIADYMMRSTILLIILAVAYGLLVYFGIRYLYVLPLMINGNLVAKAARQKSWFLTGQLKGMKVVGKIILVNFIGMLVASLIYGIVIGMQTVWDLLPGNIPYLLAQGGLLLIQIVAFVTLSYSFTLSVLILLKEVETPPSKEIISKGSPLLTVFLFLFELALIISTNSFYLQPEATIHPLIISHRGVSNKNGVQNTLGALKKTAKLKPDLVEIDIHETRDHQFVVMHDENLKKLAGQNIKPHDLTLRQLQRLSIAENGYHDKIVSFDGYLRQAQKLHQKLLIEIKTTPKDSSKLLNNFNEKYGQQVIRNHYQIQSLDYHVIEKLHQLNPKLFLIYIQPYNFTYPRSVADGYAMEYSTLNSNFIQQAHFQHKLVYAWTVDKSTVMKKMMYYHINGLITNDIVKTRRIIKTFNQQNSYVRQLWNYVAVFIG